MNIPYNNYKTQRCKYFDEQGQCKFGKNCSYAHGDFELRNPYDTMAGALPPSYMFPPSNLFMDSAHGGDLALGDNLDINDQDKINQMMILARENGVTTGA